MNRSHYLILCFFAALVSCTRDVSLETDHVQIVWNSTEAGYKIASLGLKSNGKVISLPNPSGEYSLLYADVVADSPSVVFRTNTGLVFPEKIYHYQQEMWKDATAPVSMISAGTAFHFHPQDYREDDGKIIFNYENDLASVSAEWSVDPDFHTDVLVRETLVAKKSGFFSLASPSIVKLGEANLGWATIPGYFQGREIQHDSVLAYAYGQGIPDFPALFRERCVTTMTSILDTKDSISIAVIPEPGLGRDPWEHDQNTHDKWNIALSHMSLDGKLSPKAYYPVLGQEQSYLKTGDTIVLSFRYSLLRGSWFDNVKHAANDIYKFDNALALRKNSRSLTSRIQAMHKYVTDPKTSMWNVEKFNGRTIGAQSYLGGVVGSQGDAMKNADYGAMWMLGEITGDEHIVKDILPTARNFKLVQQELTPGFFHGAAMGQYYLRKREVFVEEWGEFVEPVSLTYYTMLDIGNILLFQPDDGELKERLRAGAELLLKWQKHSGDWHVAYDKQTEKPLFQDIRDLRPTFYGLVVAHRILKDKRYLDGAILGADWLIREGVDKGHFIGVCGDARYAPDFATAQTSQALLDLFEITNEHRFKDAAIDAARMYTTSIYTHPIPSNAQKIVKGVPRQDWEISQAGLSFEHGGIMGSAQRHGPIQLASHAGLFVRMFELTGDSIFIDMARSAAIGRDAFVDDKTSVASYYWDAMNKGAGPYPHHAWWQIGWITDYLLSEAKLRSNGNIAFPRGFVTPKVGPHQSYGFASGTVFGNQANLIIKENLVNVDNPNIETILAASPDGKKLFIIMLNDLPEKQSETVKINPLLMGKTIRSVSDLVSKQTQASTQTFSVQVAPYGYAAFEVEFE